MNTRDKHILPILAATAFAFVPFIPRLRVWITVWCFLLWGYAFLSAENKVPKPGRLLHGILIFLGIIAASAGAGGVLGGEFFVGLLSVMAGLKPLEISSHRDRMIAVFIAYFIVITALFQSESLSITMYMFVSVFVTTSVLIRINHPAGRLGTNLRLSAVIMFQAIPLMMILFFLFPRIQGSLWGFAKAGKGRSGFSDTLSPGGISEIIRSDEIAFRAEFEEAVPKRNLLYWRGIVFEYFDGKSWSQGRKTAARKGLITGRDIAEYSITLEPHERNWLFALDIPVSPPSLAIMLNDCTLVSHREVKQKIRYRLKSYTTYNTSADMTWRERMLQMPAGGNPQSRAYARKWAEAADTPQKIVDSALLFFRENSFFYSLRPPLLREDTIDDFLFRTRKGYCEHYASAFVFLMRAAKVPARVVGGYLGGEMNPYGNYLTIRQADAHVWAEVWLDESGWLRVDPTAAVAPGRIEHGIEDVISPDELPAFLLIGRFGPVAEYWKKFRLGWDALSIQWDIWFAGYSSEQQKSLLSRIGITGESWKWFAEVILLTLGLTAGIAFLFAFRMFKKSAPKRDAVQEAYQIFCKKLARVGLPKRPEQGPADYAETVIAARQDLKSQIIEITDCYILLRYGHGGDAPKRLKYLVRKFTPNTAESARKKRRIGESYDNIS